jgi:hypothetical protein
MIFQGIQPKPGVKSLPALDRHHNTVKLALEKDGWTITDDPFTVLILGFETSSQVEALAAAIGKYNLYQSALKLSQNTDNLYLAIPVEAFHGIISEPLGQELIEKHNVHLLIFDPDKEEIVQWIT